MYLRKWMYVVLFILLGNFLIAPQSKDEFRILENKAFKEGEKANL